MTKEIIRDDTFCHHEYQVVHSEFFAHAHEPSLTFNNQKVSVNAVCLNSLPDVDYVQILVNPVEHKLVVCPCNGSEKDSFAWCAKGRKRYPKEITCRIFFAKIMDMMDWNPNYRYKLLGKLFCCNDKYLFSFDLTTPIIYQRNEHNHESQRTTHIPMFPKEWRNQFGLPAEDHHKRVLAKVFKGHTVFSIEDNHKSEPSKASAQESIKEEI